MSLCRHFPVPSDRMGIIWSVLPIRDCAVIEYGPAGTTHYGAEIIMDYGIEIHKNFFCTHVDENDIVMGDISRLEQAILEVDASCRPKCIFVVGSSLTSVIGADIRGLCRMLQGQVESLLVPFEHGGFRGDYSLGIADALEAAAEAIACPPAEKKPGAFNVIGACYDAFRVGSDTAEICRLMKAAFGMEPACILPYACGYDDVRRCTEAEISLVLRQEGLRAAAVIEKKGGGAPVYGAPYGYEGTKAWSDRVAEALGGAPDPAFQSALDQKLVWARGKESELRCSGLPMRAVIEGNEMQAAGIGRFLHDELGMEVQGLLTHSAKGMENVPAWCSFLPEKEKLDLLRGSTGTLVLGSDETLSQVPAGNTLVQIGFPARETIVVAEHLPIMGLRGADWLMESILSYYNKRVVSMMMQ